MPQDLEEIRADVSRLDGLAGEIREYIYDIDDDDEYWDIVDALDDLQEKITELQMRQRWI